MANKISVLLDVVTDKATSGLKGFKQSIADADGSVGKFKAGASSAFDSIKGAAGGLALGAAAALVTFGVKAVTAFTDTAVSAGKFADATGLSTEAASRWVAVADDIGISAESMEKGFGKLAVSIGKNNPLLEEYGITVKKGADGQDDMNATMLNAIDVINGIQDPTKKAAVAQAALGKGWMDMAELIGQGSDELTESMGKVSEAQVIDEEEVAKARKMRESMDNLQDSVQDLALTMGEDLVPMAIAGADALAKLIKPLQAINEWSKNVSTGFFEMIGVFEKTPKVAEDAAKGVGRMVTEFDAAAGSNDALVDSIVDGFLVAAAAAVDATAGLTKSTVDYEGALEGLNDELDERIDAVNKLVGGDIAVRDSQREAAAAVADLTAATDAGTFSTEELSAKTDDTATSLINAAEEAAAYDETLMNASGQTLTAKESQQLLRDKLAEVASTLAPGSALRVQLDGYIALLDKIPRDVSTIVHVSTDSRGLKFNAAGTSNFGGGVTVVGEKGPELVELPAGSAIHPAGSWHLTPHSQIAGAWGGTSGGGGGSSSAAFNLTVNAGMGADGHAISHIIVDALGDFVRLNGPGPIRRLTGV